MKPYWFIIGYAASLALTQNRAGLLGFAIGGLLSLLILWLILKLDERYDILWRLFGL
jgi:uncharacterized membrane protein YjgN (DUF898 family)